MARGSVHTTIYIKNMVCDRCIRVVREELERNGFHVENVILGEASIRTTSSTINLPSIKAILVRNGFELIEDKNAKLIEKIKTSIISNIRGDIDRTSKRESFSTFISREVGPDYHRLSTLFSSVENMTIEHFVILQKIEYAKELLKYGELTLSEIACKLGYSSVQHLSNQFRSITGLTPTHFRKKRSHSRKPIDHLA